MSCSFYPYKKKNNKQKTILTEDTKITLKYNSEFKYYHIPKDKEKRNHSMKQKKLGKE